MEHWGVWILIGLALMLVLVGAGVGWRAASRRQPGARPATQDGAESCLWRSGVTVLGQRHLVWHLVSLDRGQTWYAYQGNLAQGIEILGEATAVYPELVDQEGSLAGLIGGGPFRARPEELGEFDIEETTRQLRERGFTLQVRGEAPER